MPYTASTANPPLYTTNGIIEKGIAKLLTLNNKLINKNQANDRTC
jgi:hypothetical protein